MADAPQTTPPEFDTSKLRFYSFGLVANNLPMSDPDNPTEGANRLQVTPIEQLTMLDGELGSIPAEQEVEGQDASGKSYISKVTSDTALEADWLPGLGVSNRRTAPNMRRGERVLLFSYADTDLYYWTDLGLDGHLRKLETAIYSWSGTSDEAIDGTKDGNCYSLEVSTHTGQMTLKTSKLNGEHCIYAIQLNTRDGQIWIVDDLDNEIVFDSKLTRIHFKNAEKTELALDKENIYGYASDSINFKSDKSMLFQTKAYRVTCDTYELKCDTGNVKGAMTFENTVKFKQQATFDAQIKADGGLRSQTQKVYGPTETLD